MLGVLDETGTLEYGEIFVQYSHELGSAASKTSILERMFVLIYKCYIKNACGSYIYHNYRFTYYYFVDFVFYNSC